VASFIEDALTPTDLKLDFVTDPSALPAALVLPVLKEHGGGLDRPAWSDHLELQACRDDLRSSEARCQLRLPGNVSAHMSAKD